MDDGESQGSLRKGGKLEDPVRLNYQLQHEFIM